MKKKIKDLTLEEVKKIQDKICNIKICCDECPFRSCCIDEQFEETKDFEIEVEQ